MGIQRRYNFLKEMRLRDRKEAGILLAGKLKKYGGRSDVLVLALPRGGVPVAFEVSRALKLALDVFPVRKLGAPGNPELAMGAITRGGIIELNEDVISALGIDRTAIDKVVRSERMELARREKLYSGNSPAHEIKGKTIIIIDDGLATGASMKAAVKALRILGASMIIAAVPVAPASAFMELSQTADEAVCLKAADNFFSVGEWYADFTQTTDEEVIELMEESIKPGM